MQFIVLTTLFGYAFGVRYEYSGRTRSWNSARDKCRERGGELARVRGESGQDFLIELIEAADGRTPDFVWLGAQDRKDEGDWLWISDRVDVGEDYNDYTSWCSFFWGPAPNGWEFQNCLALDVSAECWNDRECYLSYPYICEFEGEEEVSEGDDPLDVAVAYCDGVLDEATVRSIWDEDRVTYIDEEEGFENGNKAGTCAFAAAEGESEYIDCCCATDDSECSQDPPEEEQEPEDPFVMLSGQTCYYLPELSETNEVCLDTPNSSNNPASCWSACEDSYAFPLEAAYLNEEGQCCCASGCLCTESTNEDGFLALSPEASDDVDTCEAIEEELADILGEDPDNNLNDLLDNSLNDVDDLPSDCAVDACLTFGQPDEACCSARANVGCANGYVLNLETEPLLCALGFEGSGSRFLTCCVEEEASEDEDEDSSSSVIVVGDTEATSPEEYCADLDLVPASIRDADEEALVLQAMIERRVDSVWLGAELRERRWVWIDGSSTAYLETRAPQIVIDPNQVTRMQLTVQGDYIIVVGDEATATPLCRAASVIAPDSGTQTSSSKKSKSNSSGIGMLIVLIIIALLLLCILCLGCCFFFKKNRDGPIYRFAPSMQQDATPPGEYIVPDSVELMPGKFNEEAPL